ncbi:hypothetical protein TNCV_4342331 [Trichonephila clavipes]|nr:hypothetical protein TNCV_4342331 [Trichonephila clavipes]
MDPDTGGYAYSGIVWIRYKRSLSVRLFGSCQGNSCQESIRLVWNYAYPNKLWMLDPKTLDQLLSTGYCCYPLLQLKTLKANVLIGSERYMKRMDGTEEESRIFFNKNGIRRKKERFVTSLSELRM